MSAKKPDQVKWGDTPILGRSEGDRYQSLDHKGHRFPLIGCPCRACYVAWVCLGVSGDVLGTSPGASTHGAADD